MVSKTYPLYTHEVQLRGILAGLAADSPAPCVAWGRALVLETVTFPENVRKTL
jgi:hypothetical protein